MSGHGHHRDVCVHGILVGQCRCPSKDKLVRRVPCPDTGYHNNLVAEMDAADQNEMFYRPEGEAWD